VAAGSRAGVKPSNNTPPTIAGDASVGSTLTANPGTWDGSAPLSFQYQWQVCDGNGNACGNISGETDKTYKVRSGDQGDTIRVRVIASNNDGSDSAVSGASAKIAAASAAPAPTPTPAANGCPKAAAGASAVSVSDVSGPARLLITQFEANPHVITGRLQSFSVRVHVSTTCGTAVQGAQVFAIAVPYHQFSVPGRATTDANGDVTLQFDRLGGFPAAQKQRLLVLFVRASKPGQNVLAGVSTRRLVSLHVNLHG
jgi:hypothetical protein